MLMPDIMVYAKDLADWNNQDEGSHDTRIIGVTVVSNRSDSFGRLFTGTISGSTRKMPSSGSYLFRAIGNVTNVNEGGFSGSSHKPSYLAEFSWVNLSDGGQASLHTQYREFSGINSPPKLVWKRIRIKNIKLVDNLLLGQGEDLDGQISSFIISFDKHEYEIIQ
jgi:hypothetical protein